MVPVEEAEDADVILYSGGIYPPADERVLDNCYFKYRPNVILMLTTLGGSPDTAYRIARFIRNAYKGGRFTVFLTGACKSAGTLIALACDRLIMAEAAHLGPLDIQIRSAAEVGEMSSGLIVSQALMALKKEAWNLFDDLFVKLRTREGFSFPTRMAAQVAAKITVGLLQPIYKQIDPMRLGENTRAMGITADYGERLSARSATGATSNLKNDALARLVRGYPSHSFVIDRDEAKELFHDVREPTPAELALFYENRYLIAAGQRDDINGKRATVYSLSFVVRPNTADTMEGTANDKNSGETDRNATSRGRPKAGEDSRGGAKAADSIKSADAGDGKTDGATPTDGR